MKTIVTTTTYEYDEEGKLIKKVAVVTENEFGGTGQVVQNIQCPYGRQHPGSYGSGGGSSTY